MERSAAGEEDERYRWREYLLHEPARGFRWLVEDRGHWAFVDNAHAGDLGAGIKKTFGGQTFSHFVSSETSVDSLVGEFPWAVTRGETTRAADYIAPPLILSEESTATEFTLSLGRYVPREEIAAAFGVPPANLPTPSGVHAAQPNPYEGRPGPLWTSFSILAAVVLVIFIALNARSRTVYVKTVQLPPTAVSGSPETVFISEPFTVSGWGNVRVALHAPLDNSWLYLDGTLASTGDAAVGDFDMEAGYFRGIESGTSWSEGSTTAHKFIGSVAPGEYTLRLAPQWGVVAVNGTRPTHYRIEVRRGVPSLSYFILALVLLFLWPAWITLRNWSFETMRWSESDHGGS
jgi:hypothetical protein